MSTSGAATRKTRLYYMIFEIVANGQKLDMEHLYNRVLPVTDPAVQTKEQFLAQFQGVREVTLGESRQLENVPAHATFWTISTVHPRSGQVTAHHVAVWTA